MKWCWNYLVLVMNIISFSRSLTSTFLLPLSFLHFPHPLSNSVSQLLLSAPQTVRIRCILFLSMLFYFFIEKTGCCYARLVVLNGRARYSVFLKSHCDKLNRYHIHSVLDQQCFAIISRLSSTSFYFCAIDSASINSKVDQIIWHDTHLFPQI